LSDSKNDDRVSAPINDFEVALMRKMLDGLPERERTALARFYVGGDGEASICSEMGLKRVQFHAIKVRAMLAFKSIKEGHSELVN
jgi:hypothetical protein